MSCFVPCKAVPRKAPPPSAFGLILVNSWTTEESVAIAQNQILCALPDKAAVTLTSSFFARVDPQPGKFCCCGVELCAERRCAPVRLEIYC